MASNAFGKIFRITTFGESHGKGMGVVIDGCPAGVPLVQEEIDQALSRRRPGQSDFVSPRQEMDRVEILSGVWDGQTTGASLALWISNQAVDSTPYESMQTLYRPGHANFTYLKKYGIFDARGGGRASARETVARVAAGAIAAKILVREQIDCVAFVTEIGGVEIEMPSLYLLEEAREKRDANPLLCPDAIAAEKMKKKLCQAMEEGDTLGGVVACIASLPPGLGDPIYEKLEANLAFAMLSIPATKGFEIGSGFAGARMKGSCHNDPFGQDVKGNIFPKTNFSGGVLGGISTGAPLFFRVAFKPISSIRQPQETVDFQGQKSILEIPKTGKHDPCAVIRAVPVVEAMTALVLVDALLMQRLAKV